MTEDRPLTEFSTNETPAATDSSSASVDAVEAVAVTYRCRPEGYVCAACGAETTRQWLDSGEFVCPDCKPWA